MPISGQSVETTSTFISRTPLACKPIPLWITVQSVFSGTEGNNVIGPRPRDVLAKHGQVLFTDVKCVRGRYGSVTVGTGKLIVPVRVANVNVNTILQQ